MTCQAPQVKTRIAERTPVLDPFAGSNTTGWVAESMGRRWIAIERDEQYAEDSGLRFHDAPAETASGQGTLF